MEFKGLHNDNRASKQPQGYWREAENILMEKGLPRNEFGPSDKLSSEGSYISDIDKTIGHIRVGEKIFLFQIYQNDSKYLGINTIENDKTTQKTLIHLERNLTINDYIVGQGQYNDKGEITLVFGGPNLELYHVNVDNPDSGDFFNIMREQKALYQPIINNTSPNFSLVSGGELPHGTYYLSVRYKKDNELTNFIPISQPIEVASNDTYRYEDKPSNTAIKVEADLGNYNSMDIAMLVTINGVTSTYILRDSSSSTTIVTLPRDTILTEDVLVQTPSIRDIKSITTHGNRYYIGGYSTEDNRPDLQLYTTRNIQVKLEREYNNPTYPYSREEVNRKSLLHHEVYAFYVAYQYPDGTLTPFYHIPAPAYGPNDDMNDEVYKYNGDYQGRRDQKKKRFKVDSENPYNVSGGFTTWENPDRYPGTKYNGQFIYPSTNGRPDKVRFHKTPKKRVYYDYTDNIKNQSLYAKLQGNIPEGFTNMILACAKHNQGLRITSGLLFGGLQNYSKASTDNENGVRQTYFYNYRTPIGNCVIESDRNDTNTYYWAVPVPNVYNRYFANPTYTPEDTFATTLSDEEINEDCYFVPDYYVKGFTHNIGLKGGHQIIGLRDLTDSNSNTLQDYPFGPVEDPFGIYDSTNNGSDNMIRNNHNGSGSINFGQEFWINFTGVRQIPTNAIIGNISNYMNTHQTMLRPASNQDSWLMYAMMYQRNIQTKDFTGTYEIYRTTTSNIGTYGSNIDPSRSDSDLTLPGTTGPDRWFRDIHGVFCRNVDSVYTQFWNQPLTILGPHLVDGNPQRYGDAYEGYKAYHFSAPEKFKQDEEIADNNEFSRILYYFYCESTNNIKLTKEERGNALSNEAGNEFTVAKIVLKPDDSPPPGTRPFPFSIDNGDKESILQRIDPSNDIRTPESNPPYNFTCFNPNMYYAEKLPSTIIRSTAFTNKRRERPKFLAGDIYTLSGQYGPIQNITSFQNKLLIHTQNNILQTASSEELKTDSISISIGSGNIFKIDPSPMFQSSYAGIPNPYYALTTRVGYTWVDPNNGVFLFNGKIANLSMKGFYYDHRKNFPIIDNWCVAHDEYNDRLLYINRSSAYSFSTNFDAWISKHTYGSRHAVNNASKTYLLGDETRELNVSSQDFSIDIVFNTDKKVVFSSFTIETECYPVTLGFAGYNLAEELIETFDSLYLYNNTQFSGLIPFSASRDEGVYRFNQIWDNTAGFGSGNVVLLDGKQYSENYRIQNRQKRRFRGEYMVVRFMKSMSSDFYKKVLYLNNIEPYIVPSP